MAIALSKDETKRLIASIQRYFADELDEDVGELKAGAVLTFFLKEIGPSVYNKAIGDAQAWIQERAIDLDAVCHEKEFTYWADPSTKRKA